MVVLYHDGTLLSAYPSFGSSWSDDVVFSTDNPPTWTPDGQGVVFSGFRSNARKSGCSDDISQTDLYMYRPFGSGSLVIQLTDTEGNEGQVIGQK